MANIIYGVAGEGMGHAIRSAVVIEHLLKKHEVVIVSSGKAFYYLSKRFNNVYKIMGLRFVIKKNKVKDIRTFFYNVIRILKGSLKSIRIIKHLIKKNKIDIAITDFEPFTNMAAGRLPLISIDNIHIIQNCRVEVSKKNLRLYLIARWVIHIFAYNADYFLITTFFFPKIRGKNTFLFAPVLREPILNANKKSENEYILVYQSSDSNKRLIRDIKNVNYNFLVYGFLGKKKKNITFREFNERDFIKDLANCTAVITNGGNLLISEAIFLGKPVLVIPILKHFEQLMNAAYFKKLGYGLYIRKSNEKAISKFISNIDFYKTNLRKYRRSDNSKFFEKLDYLIAALKK